MTRKSRILMAIAALGAFGVRTVRADYTTLYQGLSYDPITTGTGYSAATIDIKGISEAGGVAIATPRYFAAGANLGTLAESITTSGAVPLGTLGTSSSGQFSAQGEAVNASGLEVGFSTLFNGSGSSLGTRAVEWVPGSSAAVELQTLGTSANTVAGGISDAGQGNAVAYAISPNGATIGGFATLYDASGNAVSDEPVEWNSSGHVTQLGSISVGGTSIGDNVGYSTFGQTYVSAINSAGTAVGNIAAGPSTGFGTRAVKWNSAGAATQLMPLSTSDGTGVTGAAYSYAMGINSAGITIGTSYEFLSSTATDSRPVRWDASGNLTPLGNLGLTYTSGGFSGRYKGSAYSINSSGIAVGTISGISSSDQRAVRWANDGTATELQSLYYTATGTTYAAAYSINDKGLAAGSAQSAISFPGFVTPTHAVVWSTSGAPIDLNYLTDPAATSGWVLNSANAIDNNNWVSGLGTYTPADATSSQAYSRAFLLQVPNVDTWNNATSSHGDGITWDVGTNTNFNDGTGAVSFHDNDIVSFDSAAAGDYSITLNGQVSPSMTLFTNNTASYTLNGANASSGIIGTGALVKYGTGSITLNTSNTYTGATAVNLGTVVIGVAHALPAGTNLSISSNASVVANSVGTAYALQVGTISISTGGTLDLRNNDLVVHNSTLAAVASLVTSGYNGGAWNGTSGIISSTATSNPLMTLGLLVNDNGAGTPLFGSNGTVAGSFGGATPVDGDILVKYTYYGDANLDGKVDGSDYSRIDAGYLSQNSANPLTGWFNGDFNYDGVVNGSDYTLIDNAFNTQGAQIATEFATATAEIAGSAALPEPASIGLLAFSVLSLCQRRRRKLCAPASGDSVVTTGSPFLF